MRARSGARQVRSERRETHLAEYGVGILGLRWIDVLPAPVNLQEAAACERGQERGRERVLARSLTIT